MIDDEVIIVNLEKGHYYSLLGTGTDIWSGILAGESIEQIAAELARFYAVDYQEVLETVQTFTLSLTNDNILKPATSEEIESSASWNLKQKKNTNNNFVPPNFERYTDLEELLLLDPVHDVDEFGWPGTNREKSE